MAHSILRIRKLHQADLARCGTHNYRAFGVGGGHTVEVTEQQQLEDPASTITERDKAVREHIHFERTKENLYFGLDRSGKWICTDQPGELMPLDEVVRQREEQLHVKGIRENSIHALEAVLSVSEIEDYFRTAKDGSIPYSADAFAYKAREWVEDYFTKGRDKNCVLSMALHMDESNPHVHIVFQPTLTAERVTRNRYGECRSRSTRIDIRSILGNLHDKLPLRKMQSSWNEFCKKLFNHRLKDKQIEDNARSEEKQYTQKTSHRIGELRKEHKKLMDSLSSIENAQKLREAQERIKRIEAEAAAIAREMEERERKKAEQEKAYAAIKKHNQHQESEERQQPRQGFRMR